MLFDDILFIRLTRDTCVEISREIHVFLRAVNAGIERDVKYLVWELTGYALVISEVEIHVILGARFAFILRGGIDFVWIFTGNTGVVGRVKILVFVGAVFTFSG